MKFNLEVILVSGTLITGVVAFLAWLKRRKIAAEGLPEVPESFGVDFARSFFPVLLLVLVLRSFVFEPYKIPSSSMVPTLYVGDFIFVSKFSYGVRLPIIHTKILDTGSPDRGDVVVFRKPNEPETNYIKRLIGLPGDKIEYVRGTLKINGETIRLESGEAVEVDSEAGVLHAEYFGDVPHTIMHKRRESTRSYSRVIPDGYYFMMGDNRENSRDSRFTDVGLVPEANLVGKAGRIWFNFSWGKAPRWNRIGEKIE